MSPKPAIYELKLDDFRAELEAQGGRVDKKGGSNTWFVNVYAPDGNHIGRGISTSLPDATGEALSRARKHYQHIAELQAGPPPLNPTTIVMPRDASESGDCVNTLLKLLARGRPVYITTAGAEFLVGTDPEDPFAPTGAGRSLTEALKHADRLTK
jgi:hypothetical protein